MPRSRAVAPIHLSESEKSELQSLARSQTLPHRLMLRAQIVPACAAGVPASTAARRLGVTNTTVDKWRKRYREHRIGGLHNELRAGRPRMHDDDRVAAVINTALRIQPPDGSHWSARSMAHHTGVFKSTVQRWYDIDRFVEHYNANTSPFVRTATAESVLAKVQRLCSCISISWTTNQKKPEI